MSSKNEKGYTAIDIAVCVVVIFIFVSLISTLIYSFNSSSKELELRAQATNLAINEIENMKNISFDEIANLSERNENSQYRPEDSGEEMEEITGNEGFYRRIIIQDYNDIDSNRMEGIVKKITVQVKYKFKGELQTVELSSIKAKEI